MEKKLFVELPAFTGRNVPITEIAAAMHSATFIPKERKKKETSSGRMRSLPDSPNGSCRVNHQSPSILYHVSCQIQHQNQEETRI